MGRVAGQRTGHFRGGAGALDARDGLGDEVGALALAAEVGEGLARVAVGDGGDEAAESARGDVVELGISDRGHGGDGDESDLHFGWLIVV